VRGPHQQSEISQAAAHYLWRQLCCNGPGTSIFPIWHIRCPTI